MIEDHDINEQKNRYMPLRGISWQAFVESVGAGAFVGLVERAIANVGNLPSGWEIKVAAKASPA